MSRRARHRNLTASKAWLSDLWRSVQPPVHPHEDHRATDPGL